MVKKKNLDKKMWLKNMKIGKKLIIGFLIIAVIAGAVGFVGIFNMKIIENAGNQLYNENTLGIVYAGNAMALYERIRFSTLKMNDVSPNERDIPIQQISSVFIPEIDEYLKKYEDGIITQQDRNNFTELMPLWEQYKAKITEAVRLTQNNQTSQSQAMLLKEIGSISDNLQNSFDKLYQYNENGAQIKNSRNIQMTNSTINILYIVVVAGVIIALLLGIFLSRAISKPIKKMALAANKLAAGNVDITLDINSKDEIGMLAKSFLSVVNAVRSLILDTNILWSTPNIVYKNKVRKQVLCRAQNRLGSA